MHAATLAIIAGLGTMFVALALTVIRAIQRAPVRSKDRDTISIRVGDKVVSIDVGSGDSQRRSRQIDDALEAVRSEVNHHAA